MEVYAGKKKKNANIEILRILCMCMIICGHALTHGEGVVVDSRTYYWLSALRIICQPGTNIFVIITGYFMTEQNISIKKLFILWCQVAFFSVTLYLFSMLFSENSFSIISFFKSCCPVSFNAYWFARVYIYLYLCIPFLNILIRNMTRECHLGILTLGFFLMVIPASIPGISTFNGDAASNGILWFIMLYLTGAYLRKYPVLLKNCSVVLWCIIFYAFAILSYFGIEILSDMLGFAGKGSGRFTTFDAFPIYGVSVFIFCMFRNMDENFWSRYPRIEKLILKLSLSSFSVYLVHEHPQIRMLIWNQLKLSHYSNSPSVWLLLVVVVLGIYLLCTAIDIVSWEMLRKRIDKISFSRLQNKIEPYFESDKENKE